MRVAWLLGVLIFSLIPNGWSHSNASQKEVQSLVQTYSHSYSAGDSAENDRGQVQLSRALKDTRVSGLMIEDFSAKQRLRLTNKAKEFIAYQRGRLSRGKRAKLLSSCLRNPEQNPFCRYLDKNWRKRFFRKRVSLDGVTVRRKKRIRKKASVTQAFEAFRRGDFESLRYSSRRNLFRALDRFPGWNEELNHVADQARNAWICPQTQVMTALALKAEEYFPEKKYRDIAISLYEKVDSCGSKHSPSAQKSRYRLSLLHVWNGHCDKAGPILKRLSSEPGGDFVSRSLFWQARCAKNDGDMHQFEIARNRLMKNNPIGYHNVLLHQDRPVRLFNMLQPREPKVQFRSLSRPQWNEMTLAVELLQQQRQGGLAYKILTFLRDHIQGAEPEFRLYVAVLGYRNRDTITQFKLLSRLFYNHPQMVSVETLKMFYPLKKYSALWKKKKNIDPFFVLSLIRQESAFNVGARSRVGALGLMQLMPDTARRIRRRVSRRKLLSAKTNIDIGVKYLRSLLREFNGDAELALASYNAGPHRVESWLKRYQVPDRMLFLELIPFSETRNYVALITRNYFWYRSLYVQDGLAAGASRAPLSRRLASSGSSREVVFPGFESN